MNMTEAVAEFYDVLNSIKSLDHGAQLVRYGEILVAIEDQIFDADQVLKDLKKMAEVLTTKTIPELMNDLGMDKARLRGIGELKIVPELYCSIPAAVREEAKQWLSEHGYGDLITETVNASTLRAWAKEQLLNGVEIPDELFRLFPVTKVKLTRIK
jgi:hypothetical protein